MDSSLQEERAGLKHKRTQPYLLGIGKPTPSNFFVIVDQKAIPCGDQITKAVDALFKLHYAFNIAYADELKGFYAFLEHFVYEIGLPDDHVPVRARELMVSIRSLSSIDVNV